MSSQLSHGRVRGTVPAGALVLAAPGQAAAHTDADRGMLSPPVTGRLAALPGTHSDDLGRR